jgi:membrane protease YdiL (CAAX protease family)
MRRFFRFPLVRIILGVLLIALVSGIVQLPFVFLQRAVPSARQLLAESQLPAVIAAAAALATYYFFVRWTERRPVSELAGGSPFEIVLGVLLGLTLFSVTILVLSLSGTYQFTGIGRWQLLIRAALGTAAGAIIEELLFRGIIFRITEESLGSWIALAISAALFGAIHFLNPNSGFLPAIAIALEAGIFLAAAYMLTRRLWFVIGAHFGWNFAEGGIFGLSVSGHQARGGLIQGTLTGPTWLSGGAFGVEASLVAVLVCLIAAAVLLVLIHRRQRDGFINPFWARAIPVRNTR